MEKTDNAMTNPYIILLSGELRVFDMPVKPKICQFHCGTIGTCACNVLEQQHDSEVYEAIKRSIKIDNPELVPWVVLIQSRGKTISIHKKTLIDMDGMAGVGSEPLNEGDQFPLPKGLKVEIVPVTSDEEIKIGDRVVCQYGNSGNKFWSSLLDNYPVIEKFTRRNYPRSFRISGNTTDWWENDFKKYVGQTARLIKEPVNTEQKEFNAFLNKT